MVGNCMMNPAFLFFKSYKNVSEYVQEIPQSNTADQPTYPQNILSKGSWLGKEILLWSFEQKQFYGPRGYSHFFHTYAWAQHLPFTPNKYQEFQALLKYLKFYQPKKNPPFCTLTLRKDPKMHRNYP